MKRLSEEEKHLLHLLLIRKYHPNNIRQDFGRWTTIKWSSTSFGYKYYYHLCYSFLDCDAFTSANEKDYDKVVEHGIHHLKESKLLVFL